MKIGKTFTVNAPLESVWEFITSPTLVAPCIPGCSEVTQMDETHFKATVALAIGPIKTSFNVDIEQVEKTVPTFARYSVKGNEGSQASKVKSDSFLRLTELSSGQTQVEYESDVVIVGRLGKFGAGLVQKVADSIGEQFVASLKEKIEGKNDLVENDVVLGADVISPYGSIDSKFSKEDKTKCLLLSVVFVLIFLGLFAYPRW